MISIFNFLLKRCQLLQNLGEIKLDSYFASVSLKLKIIGCEKTLDFVYLGISNCSRGGLIPIFLVSRRPEYYYFRY